MECIKNGYVCHFHFCIIIKFLCKILRKFVCKYIKFSEIRRIYYRCKNITNYCFAFLRIYRYYANFIN